VDDAEGGAIRGKRRKPSVERGVIRDRCAPQSAGASNSGTEVREGYECGIGLGSFNNIQVGDTIETYEMREKPRV